MSTRVAPRLLALLGVCWALASSPALADVLIIEDPENPGTSAGEAELPPTPHDSTDGDEDADNGEEVNGEDGENELRIGDPENPGARGGLDALVIDDPENPGGDGLSIDDPENPGARGGLDALVIDDPENPGGDGLSIDDPESERVATPAARAAPQPSASRPAPVGQTVWRGELGTRLSADFRRDHAGEETLEALQWATMRLRHRFPEGRTVQVEGRLSWWVYGGGPETGSPFAVPEEGVRTVVEPELRSAWVSGRSGPWLWRAGHQTVVWGSSDLLRFADVLHARDYRRGLTGSASEARIAETGLLLTRPFEGGSAQVVWFPFFTPDRVPLFGTRYGVLQGSPSLLEVPPELAQVAGALVDGRTREGVGGALLGSQGPRATPENSTVGVRMTGSGAGWDVSASYVFGWDRTPELEWLPGLLPGGLSGEAILDALRRRLGADEFEALLEAWAEALAEMEEGGVTGEGTFGIRKQDGEGTMPGGTEPAGPGIDLPDAEAALGLLAELLDGAEGLGPLVRAEHRRRHFLMLDGVLYTGEVGWRGEAVFSPARTVMVAGGRAVRRPSLDASLGLGREGSGEGLVVSVEGYVSRWFPERGDTEGVIFPSLDYGAAGGMQFPLVRGEVRTLLEAQVGGLLSVERGVLAWTPQLTWRPAAGQAVDAGVVVFTPTRGRDGGVGDALRSASHTFVGWRGAF